MGTLQGGSIRFGSANSSVSQSVRSFSENINSRRIELGLTYEDVFDALQGRDWPEGTSAPSLAVVGHWFNGTRRPRDMHHLVALCDALRMSVDEAVRGDPMEATTAVEAAVLAKLRALSPEQQEAVLAMTETLVRAYKGDKG